jgi:hypothetical protein
MANPFPFTAGQVLTAAQMNGIGERVAFTPTWVSGLTVGNGTQSFSYVRVQNLIFISGKFILGSTSAVTGNIGFSTPITSSNQADVSYCGDVFMQDAGVGSVLGFVAYSSNTFFIQSFLTSGTYPTPQGFSATIPFTWSNTDTISVNIVYTV